MSKHIFFILSLFLIRFSTADQTFITTEFPGGLCNDVFRVAVAVAHALDHGCIARFPQVSPKHPIFHRLDTSPFPEGTNIANYNEPPGMGYTHNPIGHVEGQSIRLIGYYQNEQYFAHHREHLLKLFAPSSEILKQINDKYGDLFKENTVAVHIRSAIPDGWKPDTEGFYGITFDYFIDAMDLFDEDAHFLIFSDNVEWSKKTLPVGSKKVTFIEGNPDYIDFYMISLCSHQVIAPASTFSWWGAWLNQNPSKIVVVPEMDNKDFYLEEWTRIPVHYVPLENRHR